MSKALVIVESPAKAKTIAKFLDSHFVVEASIGHIRDLPRKASEVPEAKKKEEWADLGVNVNSRFQPLYIIPDEKKEQVKRLRKAMENASVVYLATDEDREGESISWHLMEVLKPKVPVHRLVFHEITQSAIQHSLKNIREIDLNLVHAQETRRIVDRLFGYKVSPLLWTKLKKRNLSAGRVQSVALRMTVEREKARIGFKVADWWDLGGIFEHNKGRFEAKISRWQNKSIADGSSFDQKGKLKKDNVLILTKALVEEIIPHCMENSAIINSITNKKFVEKPAPPFITSTLQQEAIRKLRWTARKTMGVAQSLYENGWITYMRTDSVSLSEQAIKASRKQITEKYGKEFLPDKPRTYRSSTKNAQEAHEAIRPAGEAFKSTAEAFKKLKNDEARLYELIWKRTMASQMNNASGSRLRVTIAVGDAGFLTSGKSYSFHGFRRAYVEEYENPEQALKEQERNLPAINNGDSLKIIELKPKGHQTKPPPRLNEASLVKAMEEKGIGRPSTYASIIHNILSRGYIFKKKGALVPTFTAFVVIDLLKEHLDWLIDYDFTARMESVLDNIASGEEEQYQTLKRFYLGKTGLLKTLEKAYNNIDRSQSGFSIGKTKEGENIEVRCGRFGEFLQLGDVIAYLPNEAPPDEITVARAIEIIEEKKRGPKKLGVDKDSKKIIYLAKGPFGFYIQLGEPEEVPKKRGAGTRTIQPKRISLLKGMIPENVTLGDAIALLSLPRLLGADDVDDKNEQIIAATGRYGPYLRRGKETCSISDSQSILTISFDEAKKLLDSSTKTKGTSIIKELGESEGKNIQLKKGRYGPYVTNGKLNASLPKGVNPDSLDLKGAIELLNKKGNPTNKRRATRKKR